MAKRLNFSIEELRELSFCALINVLLSQVESKEKEADQKDIDALLR